MKQQRKIDLSFQCLHNVESKMYFRKWAFWHPCVVPMLTFSKQVQVSGQLGSTAWGQGQHTRLGISQT